MSSCWKSNTVSKNWSNSSYAVQLYLKSILQRFSGQLQEQWAKLGSENSSPEPASTEDSEKFHSNFPRNYTELDVPENWWENLSFCSGFERICETEHGVLGKPD